MNKQIRKMLNESEQELLRATESDRLKKLGEDELIDLHTRVRRARTKYTKLHRRRAAAQVKADSSRTRASAANQRSAVKAEAFEDALARVSRRLAREAWLSADRLRADRLAATRAAKVGNRAKSAKKQKAKGKAKASSGKARAESKQRTPASKRDAAAARAATRRKQAKRDAR